MEMKTIIRAARSLASFIIAILTALIVFGLLLALLWSLVPGINPQYKAVTAIISGVSAIVIGGLAANVIAETRRRLHSVIFGLIFGLVSAGYILGASWWLPIIVIDFAFAAYFGGLVGEWLFRSSTKKIKPSIE
jgi:hypothetical protein